MAGARLGLLCRCVWSRHTCQFTREMRHGKRGVLGLYGTSPRQLRNWNWQDPSPTARWLTTWDSGGHTVQVEVPGQRRQTGASDIYVG